MSSKYGLKFENKAEDCVDQLATHHVLLTEDDKLSFTRDDKRHNNILIEGENYQALKMLQYTHKDKIDVIYIDPPYNTGNKDFVYNDVFVDEEDSFHHSKWLSFMSKRLELARELLSEQGVIFISIDDNEFAQLKLLCDQVFGESNFVCTFNWQTKNAARGVPPRNMLIMNTEYILAYCKSKISFRFNGDTRTDEGFDNPDNDIRGLWRSESIRATGKQNNYFDIIDPYTGNKYNGNWAFSNRSIDEMISEKKIIFPKTIDGTPRQKKFKDTYTNDTKAITTTLGWHSTENATKDLMALFNNEKVFDSPKPTTLIKYLLSQGSQKDSIILDFFAGSGTIGQATAELNKEDGGNRQFILVTNNDKSDKLPDGICNQVTYPRLEKTIGDENLKTYHIKTIKKSGKHTSNHIDQLVNDNKLLPILKLKYGTLIEVETCDKYTIFSNHDQSFFLGVWHVGIGGEEKAFKAKMNLLCQNNEVLVCRLETYPKDYHTITNRK